jgi:hypothetical protein
MIQMEREVCVAVELLMGMLCAIGFFIKGRKRLVFNSLLMDILRKLVKHHQSENHILLHNHLQNHQQVLFSNIRIGFFSF